MTAAARVWAREVLHVWFHVLRPSDWYGGGPAVDELLRRRFADDWRQLRHQPPTRFLGEPKIALAAIILFDQVPRNLFRDSSKAFATDSLARDLTYGVLSKGWLARFNRHERQFALMPLMHSERIADQRAAVSLFRDHAPAAFSFVRSHHAMIAPFGRFPHRNAVLGRTSTKMEKRAVAAGFSW